MKRTIATSLRFRTLLTTEIFKPSECDTLGSCQSDMRSATGQNLARMEQVIQSFVADNSPWALSSSHVETMS